MLSLLRKRWTVRLGIALFLIGQCIATAHALEFGTGPHEHDGVSCAAVLLDDTDFQIDQSHLDAWLPSPTNEAVPLFRAFQPQLAWALQPPSTGPPSI